MIDPIPLAPMRRLCHSSGKLLITLLAFSGLFACTRNPINWDDPSYLPRDSAVAMFGRDSVGMADWFARARGDSLARASPVCGTAESTLESSRFRAGWGTKGEGLVVIRSTDSGVSWDVPVVVDARGSGGFGCPPPAIFADTMNRYLHVSYFLDPQSGAGLYYTHSMNAHELSATGAGMFETPRPIVYGRRPYGERPLPVSIASRGDTVAVVYEDPNSRRARIELAISTTGGHSFDYRGRVSPDVGEASRPTVRLRAGTIEVVWLQVAGDTARAVRRIGRFR